MAYIGNEPSVNFTSFAKQDITGDGTPNYTLTYAVANANEIEVFVNNVRQEPTEAYTVSGTALSMAGNVASSDDFYVIYLGKALQTVVPLDGSVSTAKIADSAVNLTSKVTGVLPVANGGTGLTSAVCMQAIFSSPLNSIADNTSTKVTFNSTNFNIGGGTFDTTNNRYTPATAGVYFVQAHVTMKDSGDNSDYRMQEVQIRKNGSIVHVSKLFLDSDIFKDGEYNNAISPTTLLELDDDDYLEIFARCDSTSGSAYDMRPEFSVFNVFKIVGV